MITIKEAISQCTVMQHAAPVSLATLAGSASLRQLKKGGHLFWDKEKVRYLYFVAEGSVSLYKQNSIGEKKVIFVYGPGQMLNEVMLQELPASISCEALSDCQILCFPIKAFMQVMGTDFLLTKAVIDSMAVKIRRLYRQLKNTTGSIRSDKRIAAKLWKLSQDHGVIHETGVRIDLDLTVTYLADMLGMKRETVSRQLRVLADAGLIRQTPTGFFVLDRDRLQDYFKAP